MNPFICEPHGNPVRPSEPFTPDQCWICWMQHRLPGPILPSSARSLPCRYEGAVVEFCAGCSPEAGEFRHVRDCDKWERATRRPVSPAVRACSTCADYDPGKVVEFHLSAGGIGDAVSGLYTACGLADAGYAVTHYTRHREWLAGVAHPNLTLVDFAEIGVDANRYYEDQLRSAALRMSESRTQWYADNIARDLGLPKFAPSRPKIVAKPAPVLERGYVLLSPFSSHGAREWPQDRWTELAVRLADSGKRVIACGGPGDETRLRDAFGRAPVAFWWGMPAVWMLSAIGHADSFFGNDSGMAHIAGLLGTPSRIFITHLPASFVFADAPSIRGITPDGWACLGCGWQRDRGFRDECSYSCPALLSIGAEAVVGAPAKSIDAAVGERTLVSEDRRAVIRDCVLATNSLAGDVAELGVYRGGTAKLIGHHAPGAKLHLFDTFTGIPFDDAEPGGHRAGDFPSDAEDVRDYLDNPNAVFHIGIFPDTAPADDSRFRFVHLDGDTGQTTAAALDYFSPRMVPGGIIVLDDYGWHMCPGVARALHERFAPERIESRASYQAVVRH